MKNIRTYYVVVFVMLTGSAMGQMPVDSSRKAPVYKNVIRYNLSGPLVFGFDKYIVFGYERVLSPKHSISINGGHAAFPKLLTIVTDSFNLQKDRKRTGVNFSADYRIYLSKENKHAIPHGVYIGPFYSYSNFKSETEWVNKNNTARNVTTSSNFTVNTIGFELGYQFLVWKRFAIDFVFVGPGLGFYKYKVNFDRTVDGATREQLFEALEQLIQQKIPGANFVFSDKEINADGVMRTNSIGYRYIVHIGYAF